MTPEPAKFKIRYAAPAHQDIRDIEQWSRNNFGTPAARRYRALLRQAAKDLATDPRRPGAQQNESISPGLWLYHLQFSRDRATTLTGVVKHPRHFIAYRITPHAVVILRVLHDARDLQRHLPPE